MEPVTVPAAPQNVSFITHIVASRCIEGQSCAASELRRGCGLLFDAESRRRGGRRGERPEKWLECLESEEEKSAETAEVFGGFAGGVRTDLWASVRASLGCTRRSLMHRSGELSWRGEDGGRRGD